MVENIIASLQLEMKDFEDREKRKSMVVSRQAVYAENMANLFLTEKVQGEFADFNAVLATAFVPMNFDYPVPVLSGDDIKKVRTSLGQYFEEWNQLPVGQTMVLKFMTA